MNKRDIGKGVLVLTKNSNHPKGQTWENLDFYIIGFTPDKVIVKSGKGTTIALENGYVKVIDKS